MVTGKSTHNQHIERLWRDVVEGVLPLYCEIFTFMEDDAILDPFNEIDLAALHYLYIPLINERLDTWHHVWLKHQICTVKSTPLRLWISGQINGSLDTELKEQEQYFYGVEGVINEAAVDKTRSIYSSSTSDIINGDLLERLNLRNLLTHFP